MNGTPNSIEVQIDNFLEQFKRSASKAMDSDWVTSQSSSRPTSGGSAASILSHGEHLASSFLSSRKRNSCMDISQLSLAGECAEQTVGITHEGGGDVHSIVRSSYNSRRRQGVFFSPFIARRVRVFNFVCYFTYNRNYYSWFGGCGIGLDTLLYKQKKNGSSHWSTYYTSIRVCLQHPYLCCTIVPLIRLATALCVAPAAYQRTHSVAVSQCRIADAKTMPRAISVR